MSGLVKSTWNWIIAKFTGLGEARAVQEDSEQVSPDSAEPGRPSREGQNREEDSEQVSPDSAKSGSGSDTRDSSDEDAPYPMDPKNTGKCYVFNNVHHGTLDDVGHDKNFELIEAAFSQFGFQVEQRQGKNFDDLRSELKSIAKGYESKWSCIAFFFLSHGVKGDTMLVPQKRNAKVRELTQEFSGTACPQLLGKPKLFFIEMCRGGEHIPGKTLSSPTASDGRPEVVSKDRDFFVFYSTGHNSPSFYDYNKGTWFVRNFTEIFKEKGHNKPFQRIVEQTIEAVSDKTDDDPKKAPQCPTQESSLARPLRFKLAKPN